MTGPALPPLPEGDVDTPAFNEAWTADQMRAYGQQCYEAGRAAADEDALRYEWLAENAVIQTGEWRHDGKDPASTKQPLDNAIDAIRKG